MTPFIPLPPESLEDAIVIGCQDDLLVWVHPVTYQWTLRPGLPSSDPSPGYYGYWNLGPLQKLKDRFQGDRGAIRQWVDYTLPELLRGHY